jgi:hypothetical protein
VLHKAVVSYGRSHIVMELADDLQPVRLAGDWC